MKSSVVFLPTLLLFAGVTLAFWEKKAKSDCENFDFKANRIYISSMVDNREEKLLVDFGTSNSQISNPKLVHENNKSTRDAKKEALVANRLFSGKIVFDLVSTQKAEYVPECFPTLELFGSLGYDFFNRKQTTVLDFDQSILCALAAAHPIAYENYTEVKSSFNNNSLWVYLTINRKEYAFVFDTGFPGTLEMPYERSLPFLKENHTDVESIVSGNEGNVLKAESFYTKNIFFNGIYYSTVLPVSKLATRPRMGLGFIKGFNWIIDFKNRKLFVKKNTRSIDIVSVLSEYETKVSNGQLIVWKRNANRQKYALGSVITAVNGLQVTAESLCELQGLLNKSRSWNQFEIETRNPM